MAIVVLVVESLKTKEKKWKNTPIEGVAVVVAGFAVSVGFHRPWHCRGVGHSRSIRVVYL